MTHCPHCGAVGLKLFDERLVNDVPFRFDYCGRCGMNWPKDAAVRVPADGLPPEDDSTPAPRSPQPPVVFGAKVAQIADRLKRAGRDWKHSQAGDR